MLARRTDRPPDARPAAPRYVFWASVGLAVVLVAVKAYYLMLPGSIRWADGFSLRLLAAISHADVLFAALWWAGGRAALALAGDRGAAARAVAFVFVACSALACSYAVANLMLLGALGGFLTYQLLALVGDLGMVRSSAAVYLTARAVAGLVCLPIAFVALVRLAVGGVTPWNGARWARRSVGLAILGAWVIFGHYAFAADWTTRQERAVAENPQWVLMSSWWHAVGGAGTVHLTDRFAAADLADFEPIGERRPAVPVRPAILLTGSTGSRPTPGAGVLRPPNVILVVLESVAARWTGLNSGYDTTPNLVAEAKRGVTFDNFYAHIGRSSNSLVAILMSAYPKLDFREITEQYPKLAGTSIASVFHDRGYRTAFVTPSDMNWAAWNTFLEGRGFDEIRDRHGLACPTEISSWGVEDRCMVDGMLEIIGRAPAQPFFLMGWTTQTHHPYEPTPGVPMLKLLREPTPDDYELDRYLNVLHETDHHLERLFEAVRRAGLEQDTLIVVTGDHGQAFGYPHDSYSQGHTVYEEDVHVPLLLWFPRAYQSALRSKTIGSHVDLAPTITDLAGLPPAPDWQGRSLFDPERPPRAYFYVAEERFALGVREGRWKYILDLREGVEQLYDLDGDPTEQRNVAAAHPDLCARLRQRLAAWTEANARQYQRAARTGT